MYESSKSQVDLLFSLNQHGKRITRALCITQIFPEDGALITRIPVGNNLEVGAHLEKDKDVLLRDVWCLIPIVNGAADSFPARPASYDIVKEYLEEFIICTKACLGHLD